MAAENYLMNLSKYISKNFILKISLLFALVASAAVFDMYHQVNQSISKRENKASSQNDPESNKVFFCNQVTNFNLKTPGTENSIRLRFAFNQDKFQIKYYNLRTFQLMKAETSHISASTVRYFHSLPYKRVIYSSPDDTPPLV